MDERMVQEMTDKLEALTNNPEFMEKIGNMKSYEEIADALTEEGVEVTSYEVEQYLAMAKKVNSNGELYVEELDSVSGGGWGWFNGLFARFWINLGKNW